MDDNFAGYIKYSLLSLSCLFAISYPCREFRGGSIVEVIFFFTYETNMGNPITSIIEELIRTERLSHILWGGNGKFAIGHAISIPERFRSYRKLHKNINYCDQCIIIVMK